MTLSRGHGTEPAGAASLAANRCARELRSRNVLLVPQDDTCSARRCSSLKPGASRSASHWAARTRATPPAMDENNCKPGSRVAQGERPELPDRRRPVARGMTPGAVVMRSAVHPALEFPRCRWAPSAASPRPPWESGSGGSTRASASLLGSTSQPPHRPLPPGRSHWWCRMCSPHS